LAAQNYLDGKEKTAMTLSIDFTAMIGTAFTLINSLWPVFVVPIGFAIGLGLLGKITNEVRKSVG
jgi:hypothetical protein